MLCCSLARAVAALATESSRMAPAPLGQAPGTVSRACLLVWALPHVPALSDATGSPCVFRAPVLNQPFLQGASIPFSRLWH